ncbi:hypothetical protein [Nocardia huaxiensis]|uniref:DoxX family protein n=1 Tax=Nocardia huaxiensis TaxID=2755382 RepID=A0A7D6VDP2_9NOCA|nr:hypothetical protein [Nocardia huaxiensis]QLY32042.1 hypothetical protein H0264_07050 [Nocardia huaxiensis]UFS95619.1 hypothetical protein LPY97_33930 [Nocardia huaxiensis]
MAVRTGALVAAAAVLLGEALWVLLAHGELGWPTATAVVIIGIAVMTRNRWSPATIGVRVVIALLFLGSVADRFGLLGEPGAPGVSWGEYDAFVDYTRKLLPGFLDWSAPTAALTATVLETVLGFGLLVSIKIRYVAAASGALLTGFLIAMWTSVGFGDMMSYAVPVLVAGAALVATAPRHDDAVRADGAAESLPTALTS